jgi:hypothetical protein
MLMILNSMRTPLRVRRQSHPSPQHCRLPGRDPNRLHHRDLPRRGALRELFASPENQSRRLSMGAPT